MPRVAVPYSNLVPNADIANPAGTALTLGVGNGGQIPDVSPNRRQSVPELTVLRIVNGATAGNATILAGPNPPALAGGQGDLTVALGVSETRHVGPFESGRFLQADGSMIVETTQAMTVTAFRVPRNT